MLIGNAPWARGVTVGPAAEPARTVDRWGSAGVVAADGGDLELEGDLLADEHAAGFEGGVPVDAPVLAVDLGGALEADAGVVVRVDGAAAVLEVDGDGLGDALDGQVTGDPVLGVAGLLPGCGCERDLRVQIGRASGRESEGPNG